MNKVKIAKELVKLAKSLVAEQEVVQENVSEVKNDALKDLKKTFNLKDKKLKTVVDKKTLQQKGLALNKQIKDLEVGDLYEILNCIGKK